MTQIWAHRGASAYAPENTIPSFRLAIEHGADGVELDVQRTADGELVVIHDETVDRTSNGHGRVVDHSLHQLRSLDASNGMPEYQGTQIPTLREVFELVAGTELIVNVELKNSVELYPGMEVQLEALRGEFGLSGTVRGEDAAASGETCRVCYSSFNHYSLRTLLSMGCSVPLGVLYSDGLVDPWEYATYLGVQAIHPPWQVLQVPGVVDECHSRGLRVNTWTVRPEEAAWLSGLGVDAVITNHPDKVSQRLASR